MSLSAKLLPAAVKGTKVWNPDLFKATISVPVVSVKDLSQLPKIKKELKSVLLKGRNLNHILDGDEPGHKLLALDPEKIRSLEDLPSELPGLDEQCEPLARREIQLDVSHWRAPELLEAVLAEVEPGVPTLSSYSLIGHIAHVNLRDYHLPYKSVIGDILLHTLSHVKLVVNKTNTIDNTFRNFAMEVIAGDPALGFEVEVKENGLRFKFDFSQVYWNPRLSTEHQRLVESVPKEDLLCDVFAGVGPFAVPAAKKGIDVTANDLNPNSYKWLKENATLNKVSEKLVCVNKDGRDFIRENVREKVATGKRVHVAMNLPALAVEFLDAFRGLLSDAEDSLKESALEPIAHVYAFTKEGKEAIRRECETALGLDSGSLEADCQLHFVRNVAPNKDMFRATFKVPRSALFETGMSSETDSPSKKRRKMEPDGSKDEEEEES